MESSGQRGGDASIGRTATEKGRRLGVILLLGLAIPLGVYSFIQWHGQHAEDQAEADYAAFVSAMMRADAMADPLQRCLHYPDLPGSHWNVDTTRAYCELRTHKTLSLSDIDTLLKQGRAADVDRAFQGYLDTQRGGAEHPGLLDVAFQNAGFEKASKETRRIVDAWKKQSPDSAFALAASGVQYVAAAQDARGGDWASELGEQQVIDMRQLLLMAQQDLDRAVDKMPSLTAVYGSMIHLGAIGGDQDYLERAAVQGLMADPYNFAIRIQMMNQAQLRWGGQFGGLDRQQAEDEAGSAHNPLLRMVARNPRVYRATCDCGYPAVLVHQLVVRAADGNLSSGNLINLAAQVYDKDPRLAVELYGEALRFDPTEVDALQWRSQQMLKRNERQASIDAIAAAAKRFPDNNAIGVQLANIYRQAGRSRDAEEAYLAVLQRDDDEQLAMAQLGDLYNHEGREPEKAKQLADTLIERHPENPAGYIVRACNQMDHDLPGRYETIHYFIDHFGADPQFRPQVAEMRDYLAKHPEPANS